MPIIIGENNFQKCSHSLYTLARLKGYTSRMSDNKEVLHYENNKESLDSPRLIRNTKNIYPCQYYSISNLFIFVAAAVTFCYLVNPHCANHILKRLFSTIIKPVYSHLE